MRLQVAGLTAIAAVVRTVCAEPHFIERLAEDAVLLAGAAGFFLIALRAEEFVCHRKNVARDIRAEKREFRERLPFNGVN
ncbi:MAG: hypothetical protein JOZ10_05195 [Acidobacteria bacterium]|nr:hypothetical protein [Acidobacteriota bacterium]